MNKIDLQKYKDAGVNFFEVEDYEAIPLTDNIDAVYSTLRMDDFPCPCTASGTYSMEEMEINLLALEVYGDNTNSFGGQRDGYRRGYMDALKKYKLDGRL